MTDFTTWDRATLEQFAREARDKLVANKLTIDELVGALKAFLERYTELINSGDCGNWNPETESEVIQARAAITKHDISTKEQ